MGRRAQCNVLLIDDSPDMRRLIGAYLADPAISLTVAASGRDGIKAFSGQQFDLVLMDIDMPEMDGYETTRRIRTWEAEQKLAQTPILALTAISDFGASKRVLSYGCTMHLTKPIMRSTLLQIVYQYSPRRTAPRADAR